MAAPLPAPTRQVDPAVAEDVASDVPWQAIVWNDPVNLMSYVTYVLQKLFGYPEPKATALMLDVHHKGKAAVSSGDKDKVEADVAKLHAAGLWATMQRTTRERLEALGARRPKARWSRRSTRRRPRCCAGWSTRCARCSARARTTAPPTSWRSSPGMRTGPSTRPDDRVLARLLPDFTTDDADLAAGAALAARARADRGEGRRRGRGARHAARAAAAGSS